MIAQLFTDLINAINALLPRTLTPDECRVDVPAWREKPVVPKAVPQIKSTARRLPGDANVYEWNDLATVTKADGLTAKDWGAVSETKATSDARLAAFVKSERAKGKTYAEIAVEARRVLDMKVSRSTVEKVGAALLRAEGEGVADSGENESAN